MGEKAQEKPIVECRIIETEDGFVIEPKGEWAVKFRKALAKGELSLGCGPGMAAKVVCC